MKERPLLLIAEDDDSMRFLLEETLNTHHYNTISAANGEDALKIFCSESIDLTILDIKMPKMNGLEVLETIKNNEEEALVIILTAFATIKTAVEAMKRGAYDYVTKPFDTEELLIIIKKALEKRELIKENRALKEMLNQLETKEAKVEVSTAMSEVYERAYKVASTDYTVLLEGESGTGKSRLARKIHDLSYRAREPFIRVNCASLPPNLVESELFGYEKGAFTGAARQKLGKVEMANKGTLFLDEISTLDLSAQASLLHLLQDQEFERVGGTKTIKVDVRIIAASNQSLSEQVAKKYFREDLFFRLNVFGLLIPPLRNRKEDILPLVSYIINKLSPERKINLSMQAAIIFKEYNWPGNIREAENIIKHALILLGNEDTIRPVHLPEHLTKKTLKITEDRSLKEILSEAERQAIRFALANNNNDVKKTAQSLKIAKRSLYYRMSKLNIYTKFGN